MPKTLYILLFLCPYISILAQPLVETIPPEFIAPCGPTYTYEMRVINDEITPFTNITLTYQLPSGLNYVNASISGGGISESNVSDPNAPVFQINTLAPGTLLASFEVEASCEANNGIETLRDTIGLTYDGGASSYLGSTYNINLPVLQVVNSTNISTITNINSEFERSFTIVNSGFREVTELIIEDVNGASIDIVGVAPGAIIGNNPTRIQVSGADFSAIGDFDQLFEPGEQLLFTQTVRLNDCGNGNSSIRFGWGCGGEMCEVFDTLNATVGTANSFPQLSWQIIDEQFAGICQDGFLEVEITNTGTEITSGAGAAYNILLEPGVAFNSVIPTRDTCLQLSNFSIGNTSLPPTIAGFLGYGLVLEQLTTDADGPGGLEDLDGDGAFDDLAVGESFSFRLDLSFSAACLADVCGEFRDRMFWLKVENNGQCSDDLFSGVRVGPIHQYSMLLNGFKDNLNSTAYEDMDTLNLQFQFDGVLKGFDRVCTNDSVIIHMILPDVLALPSNFSPTLNDIPLSYFQRGDTLNLIADEYLGELELNFIAECPPPQAVIDSLPCGGGSGISESLYQIDVWMSWYCDVDNCTEPIRLFCNTSNPFLLSCPPLPSSLGVYINEMQLYRKTLGWTDETLTRKVDKNDPKINRRIAMTHDLVQIDLSTFAIGTGVFDSSYLQLSYQADPNVQWLNYYSDTLYFFDSETGQRLQCVNAGISMAAHMNGQWLEEISLLEFFQPGGCFEGFNYTSGDSLSFNLIYEVSEQVPEVPFIIPDLLVQFNYFNNGEAFSCGGNRALLKVFSPTQRYLFFTTYSGEGCDTISLNYRLMQGKRFLGMEDFFPYEYRPLAIMDSLSVQLPNWANYSLASTRYQLEYRPDSSADGPVFDSIYRLSDPVLQMQGNERWLHFDPSEFPVGDYIVEEANSILSFDIIPTCIPDTNSTLPYKLNTVTSFYREESRVYETLVQNPVLDFSISNLFFDTDSPVFQGLTDTAVWTFQFCNGVTVIDNLPFTLLHFDLPTNEIQLIELREILPNNQVQLYPLQLTGTDFLAQIGNTSSLSCRLFELRALYTSCEKVNFDVFGHYFCDSYPTDPEQIPNACNVMIPEMELILDPQEADLQINLIQSPVSPIDLCEALIYEFKIINGGLATALNVEVAIDLPPDGMDFLNGTAEFHFGSSPYSPLPDPTRVPGSNRLVWQLNTQDLLGINQFPLNEAYLRFQLQTDCDFKNLSTISYDVSWNNECNDRHMTNPLFALPFELAGAPEGVNQFDAQFNPTQLNACVNQSLLNIHMLNLGGSPNDSTSVDERIRIKLPEGINYIAGSFNNLYNLPNGAAPFSFIEDSLTVLEWTMPAGLGIGDSIGFQIAININDQSLLDCGLQSLFFETSELVDVPCASSPGSFCSIDFIATELTFDIDLLKPTLELQLLDISASPLLPNQEQIQLGLILTNTSLTDGANMLPIDLYVDQNGDGVFDPAVDPFAGSVFQDASLLAAGVSDTLRAALSVDAIFGCFGLFISVNTNTDQCLCNAPFLFVPPVPFNGAGPDQLICAGEQVQVGFPALPGYTYDWSPSDLIDDTSTSMPLYLGNNLNPLSGTYDWVDTLYLQTTRAAGCSSLDTLLIRNIKVEASVEVMDSISCFGSTDGSIGIVVNGGLAPLRYNWNTGVDTTDLIDSIGAGQYLVTVTDQVGCTAEASIDFEEPALIQLNLQADSLNCHNDQNGEILTTISGGVTPYTYSWSTGAMLPNLDSLSAGSYALTLTDAHDCISVDSIKIDQPNALQTAFEVIDATCFNQADGSITILEPTDSNYIFSFGGRPGQTNPAFGQLIQGDYTVSIFDRNGCGSHHTFTINSPPEILVEAIEDQHIELGDTVQLSAMTHLSVANNVFWTPASSLSCDSCLTPLANPLETTTYTISVTNIDGCTDEDEVEVFVEKNYHIFFPNAFTPNQDGNNDRFTGFSNETVTIIKRLLIFDRWGEQLYEQRDFLPNEESFGWDGTLKGELLNSGVFVYMAEVEFIDGSVHLFEGSITLIR